MTARYTSYRELYSHLLTYGGNDQQGEQIFRRIAANIMLGNNDDHARNHAVFWDGSRMQLTPAFDIEPVRGPGWESNQAISYGANGQRDSNLQELIAAAPVYGLSSATGKLIVEQMLEHAQTGFEYALDMAKLTGDQTAGTFHEAIWPGHALPSP